MIKDRKKSLVLTAALAAPLVMSAPAMANTSNSLVNPQAVNEFTSSVKLTLDAYDSLQSGNMTVAKTKLERAVQDLERAIAKDPTLGFSQKPAKAFHTELKTVKTKLNSRDSFEAKAELDRVLSSAGIMTMS